MCLPRTIRSLTSCANAACSCSAKSTSIVRSEEHTSELQSLAYLVCRLLLEKKNKDFVFYPHIHQSGVATESHKLFLLMLPPPPTSTLFPYTTLFRSTAPSTMPESLHPTLLTSRA